METNTMPRKVSSREVIAELAGALRHGAENGYATAKAKGWLKWIAIAITTLLGYGYAERVLEDNTSLDLPGFHTKASAATTATSQPPTAQLAEEISKSFVVQSAGKSGNRLFFNDNADYKSAGVFTVVVDTSSCPTLAGLDPRSMKGKTISAKGLSSSYNGKPQLVVSDASKVAFK